MSDLEFTYQPLSIIAEPEHQAVLPRDHYSLSPREDQILSCMWLGKTDPEVAYELQISTATIREYKKRLQLKVGAGRPSEIVGCAVRGLPHLTASQ